MADGQCFSLDRMIADYLGVMLERDLWNDHDVIHGDRGRL